jgi:hypothetical protein
MSERTPEQLRQDSVRQYPNARWGLPEFKINFPWNPPRAGETERLNPWQLDGPRIPARQPGESAEAYQARRAKAEQEYSNAIGGKTQQQSDDTLFPGARKAQEEEEAKKKAKQEKIFEDYRPFTPKETIEVTKQGLQDTTNAQIKIDNNAAGNTLGLQNDQQKFLTGENQASRNHDIVINAKNFGHTVKLREIDFKNTFALNNQIQGFATQTNEQLHGHTMKQNAAAYAHTERGWKIDDARLRRQHDMEFTTRNALSAADILNSFRRTR